MTAPWDTEPAAWPGPAGPPEPPPPQVPPPPPGPGVQAPFAAPPTERDRKRLWIGLGLGAALLLLCCGGGAFGIGALVVTRTDALRQEGTSVVRQYLDGLRDGNYRRSYNLLCSDVRATTSLDAFTSEQDRRPHVVSYTLAPPVLTGSGVIVDADVTTSGGTTDHRSYDLVEDTEAAALRICAGE
jgi:hypothetical protein